MTALLTHYGGRRYTMDLASCYRIGSLCNPDPERKAAADADRKMLDAVYPDVWERNAELVDRVEHFLIASFPHFRKGNAHHTLDALRRAVWKGEVFIVEREPEFCGGYAAPHVRKQSGFRGVDNDDEVPFEEEPWPEVPDTSAADWDIWHDANNQAMMHAAVRAAPALFLPMFAKAGWISRYGVPDLSEGFARAESTPLGDAEGFELGESTLSDDVMDMAARAASAKRKRRNATRNMLSTWLNAKLRRPCSAATCGPTCSASNEPLNTTNVVEDIEHGSL
ncbi:hypothetical protein B0G84_5065 [Paraburkholderia sp. BL8N3]|nr:hypothetical protein [Paraburkholderia sp. BL8N3]TCK39725.1 hypothetical protein B0G84_5065 [Paraburkholderia sp. BL8N3]